MAALNVQPDEKAKIEQIQSLSVVNNRQALIRLAYILIGFFATSFFARLFFTAGFLFIFLLIGIFLASWTHAAIIEELHDGYHYRLMSSRPANEILTALYASSVGISVVYARAAHLWHHRYFGTPEDPDYPIYLSCPVGLMGWLKYLAFQFSGYAALKGLLGRQGISSAGEPDLQHPVLTAVMHIVLLGLCWLFIHPAAYFVFWLFPLLTLTFGMGKFRTMVDHWTPEPWLDSKTGKEFHGALYNFDGLFQSQIVGAQFGYNFHGMHHLSPSIPNYNLEKAIDSDYSLCPPELVRTTTYYARLKEMLFNGYNQSS